MGTKVPTLRVAVLALLAVGLAVGVVAAHSDESGHAFRLKAATRSG